MFFQRITAFIALSLAATISMADSALVRISTTQGDMVIELDQKRAPGTVDNFLQYVNEGFYDGTIFHRVIEGFMVQGGGFDSSFKRKQTRDAIRNEANNGLRNERYTIAMARTNAPHSATAQFFINSEDNRNLDHSAPTARGWGYTVFGRVIEGKDIVDKISQLPTGPGGPFSRDAPREKVVINSATQLGLEPVATESAAVTATKKPETVITKAVKKAGAMAVQ